MWKKKGRSRRYFQKHNNRNQRESKDRKENKDKDQVICYECNKPGHYKSECPNLKKKSRRDFKEKKKSLMATWDDSESSSSDEDDEQANIALMVTTDSDSDIENVVNSELNSHSILQNAFDELLCESTKLAIEYKSHYNKNNFQQQIKNCG